MKDFPYTDLQRAWLEDLKTTDAPQTKYVLHRIRDGRDNGEPVSSGYCCLGRACVVAGLKENLIEDADYVLYGGGLDNVLPFGLAEELQLNSSTGSLIDPLLIGDESYTSLADLNDGLGWTFKQIAEYIEANPENVFTNLGE